MKHTIERWHWLRRPQLWVGLLAFGFACSGLAAAIAGAPEVSASAAGGGAGSASQTAQLAGSIPQTPAVTGERERAVNELSTDCAAQACIALTFDDGPNAKTTPRVLDTLEREHVPATFFIMGMHVKGNEALLRRMYADGDEIGNHSWSHPDFTKLNQLQMRQQIEQTQQAIIAAGLPRPTLFRPPYGAVNDAVRANVHMSLMFWNEDPKDWATSKAADIVASVMAAAHPGGVVIMHDVQPQTAEALPEVIRQLRARGYQFATVSHMLNIAPGQPGDFYGHPPK